MTDKTDLSTETKTTEIKNKFPQWCKPKRGASNPEIMTNALWTHLVETNISAYKAHKHFGTGEKKSPGWCFERFGQSTTDLGRFTVYIGGEHEDYYDEDFYIYNDVIVKDKDGTITIYGYPEDVFPPTDSHSATWVNTEIFIIGCIGYPDQENKLKTSVRALNLFDFSIRTISAIGEHPGWLHKHTATFFSKENVIICEGGVRVHEQCGMVLENLATWQLCLTTNTWSRLADKAWSRWALTREDNQQNSLWKVGEVAYEEQSKRSHKFSEEYRKELTDKGYPLNAKDYESRYRPPLNHTHIPTDDYRRHIINIDGVTVRFDENNWDIIVTVEGNLNDDIISKLKTHGLETLSKIEATPYKIINI
ncbi:MAG: hypothetical protein ACPGVT_08205 [Maricaulaceae bacterium]